VSRTLFITALAISLTLGACSDDGESADDTPDTTAVADDAPDTTATPDDTTTTAAADDGPCPAATELTITGSDTVDGPLEVVTEFADVTFDESADLVFASYEIPEDPQFGVSAPVGDPLAPEGGVIFQVSLFAGVEQVLEPGEYVDDDEAEPRITFISLYNGSERINPLGDHTVTITEYTEDHICGEITAVGETELQSFPIIQGRFVTERV
jgi:hypothetical protein